MPEMEKIIKGLEELYGFLFNEYGKRQAEEASLYYDRFLTAYNAITLLKEQQQQIWEFRDQVEYLTDKLKEKEGK